MSYEMHFIEKKTHFIEKTVFGN